MDWNSRLKAFRDVRKMHDETFVSNVSSNSGGYLRQNLAEYEEHRTKNANKRVPHPLISPILSALLSGFAKQLDKHPELYWLKRWFVPINRHRLLLQELRYLNALWMKGELLEERGYFTGKSARYEERMCRLLGKISVRQTEVWEILNAENPKLLRGEFFCLPDELIDRRIEARDALSSNQ